MLSTTRTDEFENIRPYAGDPIVFTLEGATDAIWIPGQACN